MTIRFSIDRWAAWAPGLPDREAWLAWLAEPRALEGDGAPPLAEMAPMMRRRVERLGRIALQAAYWGLDGREADGAPGDCPLVFASRYGDIARSVELLRQLAAGEALSPTAFSLSVHNAIGALFSIARSDTAAYTAVAAGAETAEAAFTEALGLLADGAPAVLVVCYDEPLPPLYRSFAEHVDFPRAWACRLVRAEQGGFSLTTAPGDGTAARGDWPADLAALRFLLSGDERYVHHAGTRQWHWARHA